MRYILSLLPHTSPRYFKLNSQYCRSPGCKPHLQHNLTPQFAGCAEHKDSVLARYLGGRGMHGGGQHRRLCAVPGLLPNQQRDARRSSCHAQHEQAQSPTLYLRAALLSAKNYKCPCNRTMGLKSS